MRDDVHMLNGQVARAMAVCSLAPVCLLIFDYFSIFDFGGTLAMIIFAVGLFTTLSPYILYRLKVKDTFLKYYMPMVMAMLIGVLGSFNNIGIYITFVLVPVASCLYFDTCYTVICSIFSYIVMVVSVYINSAGKFEIKYLGWEHLETFRAYLIGFTIEYLVIVLFLALVMKRAKNMMRRQHQAYLKQMEQDARYQLLVKETKDVVFEYYPNEDKYTANRSIYQSEGKKNKPVYFDKLNENIINYPGLAELYNRIRDNFNSGKTDEFEVDLSYELNGKYVTLWYSVEYFIVSDGDKPISIIGKMRNITRAKQSAAGREQIENLRNNSRKQNSILDLIMKESEHFDDDDYGKLAAGHRFLAQIMDDVKYAEDLVAGINRMLTQIGLFFNVDRICVVETDMSSGTSDVAYQWSRQKEDFLENYFTQMKPQEVQRTISTYDKNGYIEINPSHNIMNSESGNTELREQVVDSVILGNQLWIPMLANGKYMGAICFDRYDTTRYQAVEKFLFSEVVNTLTAHIMKINAEKANKAKSDFLSAMSHEIRTPMNAIVGMTEVALREDMPVNTKRCLTMVKSSAFGLLTLINDILDYSKIEAGKFDIVPEKFSILSVLSDVKEIILAKNNGKLEIDFLVPEDLPSVMYGDSVRIKQVMINYCTNAIKYSDEGRVEISISLDRTGDDKGILHFAVKDNGIGIKKEDLPKLFKSYTRVDETVNHHKEGTGLGLAICRQLVELMDGTVNVESEYGKGSTFSFTIPVNVIDWNGAGSLVNFRYEDKADCTEESAELITAPDARILIVDDTPINIMVAEALMEPAGMKIDTALSGEEALNLIERQDYDLIFMDHFMPGMDGIEVTHRIRKLSDDKKKNVPIVALTADAMEGVREELISHGMDDFLTKPIIIEDIYHILRKWLPEDKIINNPVEK